MKKLEFKYQNGRNIPYDQVAEKFWDLINPKTQTESYDKRKSEVILLKNTILTLPATKRLFWQYILDENNDFERFKRIVTGKPIELKSIIEEINQVLHDLGKTIDQVKDKKITNRYDRIRKKYTKWIIDQLRVKACPYCGTQFLLSFEPAQKVLCQLDHFWPKDSYPYFYTSFFNLIPSCSYCNHSKSDDPTSLDDYPHPYHDNLDHFFFWKTSPQDVIEKIISERAEIEIEIGIPSTLSPTDKVRFENHVKRFKLDKIYKNHSDVASEIYWKKHIYNESKRKELLELLKRVNLTEKEIDRFIVGNYYHEDDLLKRPLSKLYKDLAKEIGLLPG